MHYGCNVKEVAVLADWLSCRASRDEWQNPSPSEFVSGLEWHAKQLFRLPMPSLIRGMQNYLNIGDPETEEGNLVWLRRSRREICEDLLRRLKEDLDRYTFIALASYEAKMYHQRTLFTKRVRVKFPALQDDIREAGNCYALGRYGGCAYHVSVIMENAARRLARRVKVKAPPGRRLLDLSWQTLSDLITKQIKDRPRHTARHKSVNEQLSEANNHLWNVKEAYRNKIAHGRISKPKRSRNWRDEESRLTYILLQQAEIFLDSLAKLM